jgi:hypothetical protein
LCHAKFPICKQLEKFDARKSKFYGKKIEMTSLKGEGCKLTPWFLNKIKADETSFK